MSQNLQGQPPSKIDLTNEHELRWWAKELETSEDHVRGAVSQVGNSPEAVRQFLKGGTSNERSQGHTLFSADPEVGSGVAGLDTDRDERHKSHG